MKCDFHCCSSFYYFVSFGARSPLFLNLLVHDEEVCYLVRAILLCIPQAFLCVHITMSVLFIFAKQLYYTKSLHLLTAEMYPFQCAARRTELKKSEV